MAFNITVPWKIRLRSSRSQSPAGSNWWNRKKYRDGSGSRKSTVLHEDDLDHLGALHGSGKH
ncbi:MAG: hypothetical protein U9P12_05845 [Verrucomicrobiota bacterium]|nr:hypothetical protein [Verrucomicrobiota bacterium]